MYRMDNQSTSEQSEALEKMGADAPRSSSYIILLLFILELYRKLIQSSSVQKTSLIITNINKFSTLVNLSPSASQPLRQSDIVDYRAAYFAAKKMVQIGQVLTVSNMPKLKM